MSKEISHPEESKSNSLKAKAGEITNKVAARQPTTILVTMGAAMGIGNLLNGGDIERTIAMTGALVGAGALSEISMWRNNKRYSEAKRRLEAKQDNTPNHQ